MIKDFDKQFSNFYKNILFIILTIKVQLYNIDFIKK